MKNYVLFVVLFAISLSACGSSQALRTQQAQINVLNVRANILERQMGCVLNTIRGRTTDANGCLIQVPAE